MIEDTREFEIYEVKQALANELNENSYEEEMHRDVDDLGFYGSEW